MKKKTPDLRRIVEKKFTVWCKTKSIQYQGFFLDIDKEFPASYQKHIRNFVDQELVTLVERVKVQNTKYFEERPR